MTSFFTRFPKIRYNIENRDLAPETTITDIMFRINLIQSVINNQAAYYYYAIEDSDTPEILAYKFYGSVEYHWIILYANNIFDPVSEWPKDYVSFHKYIVNKYGSVENAQLTNHHYEMIIRRENVPERTTTETKFIITQEKLTDNALTVPFDYYEGTGSLEDTQGVEFFSIDSKDVIVTKERNAVSNYDYEQELNEQRRHIKVMKRETLQHILSDFRTLTSPFTGRLRRTLRQGG